MWKNFTFLLTFEDFILHKCDIANLEERLTSNLGVQGLYLLGKAFLEVIYCLAKLR